MRRHVTTLAATAALAAALAAGGGCQSDERNQPRGLEDYRTNDIGANTTPTGTTGVNPALRQQPVTSDEAVRLRSAGDPVDAGAEPIAQPQQRTATEQPSLQQQAQPAGDQQAPPTNFEGYRNPGEGEQSVPSGAPGDMEGADRGALPQQQPPAQTGTGTGTGQ